MFLAKKLNTLFLERSQNFLVSFLFIFQMTLNSDDHEDMIVDEITQFQARKPMTRQSTMPVSISYDNSIRKSLDMKRMSQCISPNASLKAVSEHKKTPYDHFLIVGLPLKVDVPENPNLTPKILMMYPSAPLILEPSEYERVVSFCFPNGVQPVPPGQNYIHDQFVFRINKNVNGEQIPVYGICTQFDVTHVRNSFFFDADSSKYLFCICFLTTQPLIAPTFQFSCLLVLWINQKLAYKFHPNPDLKFDTPSEAETVLLPGLRWGGGSQSMNSIRIPRKFLQELDFFYTIELAPFPKILPMDRNNHYMLSIPALETPDKYILGPSLSYLFSALSVRNITKVYSLMLLDSQLVFISKDPTRLTLSILAAVNILNPFEPCVVIMPVIPNNENFLPLLDSPTPFIIGVVVNEEGLQLHPESEITVINLDTDTIIERKVTPIFPDYEKVEEQINLLFELHKAKIIPPPKFIKKGIIKKDLEDNPDFDAFIERTSGFAFPQLTIYNDPPKYILTEAVNDQVVDAFRKGLPETISYLMNPCFVSDTTDANKPVTIFNHELFVSSINPDWKEFFDLFINTQIFQQFCDIKTDEKEVYLQSNMMKNNQPPLVQNNDDNNQNTTNKHHVRRRRKKTT